MPTTSSPAAVIPLGTSNAAFAQLASTVAPTRSGTTATVLLASTNGLSLGSIVLVQGNDLMEYNGVFTISALTTNTSISYVMKADPGASSGSAIVTVDKVTLGTAVDMTAAYDGLVWGGIQNGNAAPGVAAQIWVGLSPTSAEVDYTWRPLISGGVTAKAWSPCSYALKPGMFVNFAVCRNTTNSVDCVLQSTKTTGI